MSRPIRKNIIPGIIAFAQLSIITRFSKCDKTINTNNDFPVDDCFGHDEHLILKQFHNQTTN